ncbi:MAG TPA: XdhC family protein [Acidimicrobiales bacterium]|nr:XdhC family protein [Acidimicrobiales bacterium]
MEFTDVVATVSSWLAEGHRAAVARPVAFAGFSSRRPGEILAVSETGQRTGEVLGRSISDTLAGRLADLMKPDQPRGRLIRLPVSATAAAAAGLACGGTVTVALHDAAGLPGRFWSTVTAGRPVALASVTGTSGTLLGSLVVAQDGISGTLSDPALEEQAIASAKALLAAGRTASSVIRTDERTLVIDAIVPAVQLVVAGSGDLAVALSRQADLLGWHFMAFDDAKSATEAIGSIGPGDGIVVLSHDPAVDTPVLAAAVASRAGYLGALGSRRTQTARHDRLVGLGVSEAALATIHGPAGLDLGARTPEEIALAICAELLAVRSDRTGMSLVGRGAPINS